MSAVSIKKEEMITIPRKEYDEMKETLEILSDPRAVTRILKSLEQAKSGKTIGRGEFKRRVGL